MNLPDRRTEDPSEGTPAPEGALAAYERLTALAIELSPVQDRAELLQRLADAAHSLIGCEYARVSVYLDHDSTRISASAGELTARSTRQRSNSLRLLRIPLTHGGQATEGELEVSMRGGQHPLWREQLFHQLAKIGGAALANLRLRVEFDRQARLSRSIAENATLGLCVIDERQRCTYLNPTAERIFGFSLEEIRRQDKPLYDIIHRAPPDGSHVPSAECDVERAFPTCLKEQGEDVFVRPDGSSYPVRFTASPLFEEGRRAGTVIEVRDVTEEKRAEEERAAQHLAVETLLETSQVILGELDTQAVIKKLTDYATRLTGAAFGAFFYNDIDEAGETYLLHSISGVDPERFATFPMPRNTAIFAPTFAGEAIVRLDDVTRDPRFGKNPPYGGLPEGHLPVRSYLAAPVRSRSGEVFGGLFFGHPDVGVFTDREEHLVGGMANQAGIALDNSRWFDEVRRARQNETLRATLGQALAQELASGDQLPDRLRASMQAVVTHVGAAFAQVWTLSEDEDVLELRASAGIDAHIDCDRARVSVGKCRIGLIAAERAPHLTNDVQNDPSLGDPEWAAREGMVSFAGYPLLSRGRLIGVMALFAKRKLPPSLMSVLSDVADQLALSIEREMLETERERFREIFIGMLGHDLRNPLSAVKTGVQLIRATQCEPLMLEKSLARIERSTDRMARMVDQLLEFARTRAGASIPIVRQPCALGDICQDAVEELRQGHPESSIEVLIADPARGMWDRDRLAQAVSNLGGNALVHGDPRLPVTIRLARIGQRAELDVHNFGAPIRDTRLLFDPFRRATYGKSSGTQGLGLGLYITRQVILAHGGQIDVFSSGEEGTSFKIALPLVEQTGEPGPSDGQASTFDRR